MIQRFEASHGEHPSSVRLFVRLDCIAVILLMDQWKKSGDHQLRLVVCPHHLQGFFRSQVVSPISSINNIQYLPFDYDLWCTDGMRFFTYQRCMSFCCRFCWPKSVPTINSRKRWEPSSSSTGWSPPGMTGNSAEMSSEKKHLTLTQWISAILVAFWYNSDTYQLVQDFFHQQYLSQGFPSSSFF